MKTKEESASDSVQTWIAGKPTMFPCFVISNEWPLLRLIYSLDGGDYSYWMPASLPPPPRAKTLAEMDADAFDLWARATEEDNVFCESEAWKAGIAYEREQIAKIIESGEWGSELNKILARVKGTK